MSTDLDTYRHKEWLGLLQPVGLVVSPPALIKAQAIIDRGKLVDLQEKLLAVTTPELRGDPGAWIPDFPGFTQTVLGWLPNDLKDPPEELTVALPNYGEVLSPTYAVKGTDGQADTWILLIQTLPTGQPFDDEDPFASAHGWKASSQAKFERLLRETKVYQGILFNGTAIRLVVAPNGESSGHVTFPVQAMTEVSGRLILGALDLLLGSERLFNVLEAQRLPQLLEDSRHYQAEVSTKLAEQVLDALWELLKGFQAADATVNGKILRELAETDPQHIYGGLITTLMRLVFLLYAEDEGLMPDDEVYQRNYAVSGLYEKLREDAGNYPDTMDQRYGAWATLLSLFRLVYDGGGPTEEYLPARHGQLFDPDEYPFLEGRPIASHFATFGRIEAPRISDGVIYRMLDKLLVLDGERLSYRALDVEQIGSVYEAIMGYEVEIAHGRSIAVRSKDVVVDVDKILAAKPADRANILKAAECELKGAALKELKEAKTAEDIAAAIGRRVSPRTPNLLAAGSLFLQPGEERRRSGSHYTPRKLTQPIVEKTLEPVLKNLGEHPTPEQLLDLKVCDLAMGSAAFLVEACRQLADKLVEAWNYHGKPADLPETVEDVVVARRLVAQRCLYGVDKNPFAVNLARLSLWLVTLAKDLPFTFLDHALKCGDSLVGLTRAEIGSFGARAAYEPTFFEDHKRLIKQSATKALAYRQQIQTSDTRSDRDAETKQALLQDVDRALEPARLTAKIAVASFFAGDNAKQRQKYREEFGGKLIGYEKGLVDESEIQSVVAKLTAGTKAVLPFNWELEFPEVFERENPGFDAIVGNPPFLNGKRISTVLGNLYKDCLSEITPECNSNADLVTHFLRRAFSLIRTNACLGLVTTKTIAKGDTRSGGLRYICQNGGTIYHAQKRFKWAGVASVLISVVHIRKGSFEEKLILDGNEVPVITAFLFHSGGSEDPAKLLENANKCFQGTIILGMGFTFDDSDPKATPVTEMRNLSDRDSRNKEIIFPYIGAQEVNSSPTHAYHRYVIDFRDMSEEEARQWPDLLEIVERKVKPEREVQKRDRLRIKWWQHAERRPGLMQATANCSQVLVTTCSATSHLALAFLPSNIIFANTLAVIASEKFAAFATLQSSVHEIWAWFFGSSMKDDLRYNPPDCFQTFPFPPDWETNITLEVVGKTYYEFRADLMVRHNEGLTTTYNRFHDPDETNPDILKLRELHAQMDRAVLDAYGWTDIPTNCEFLLDYEDEDDEGTSKRKKPWRYRWPEEVHDEVLARLLKLNQERYQEEIIGGSQAKPKRSSRKSKQAETLGIPGLD